MGLGKNLTDAPPSTVKRYFLFLATVLLLCMGLRKKTFSRQLTIAKKKILLSTVLCIGINIRPPPGKKIVSDYNTTMVYGTLKKFNHTQPSQKKKSGYSTTMVHGT